MHIPANKETRWKVETFARNENVPLMKACEMLVDHAWRDYLANRVARGLEAEDFDPLLDGERRWRGSRTSPHISPPIGAAIARIAEREDTSVSAVIKHLLREILIERGEMPRPGNDPVLAFTHINADTTKR